MTENDAVLDERTVLRRYLQAARDTLVWKLDGLDERAARWPHTPTGTNLLGLVKHAAGVEVDYFGVTFGRPWPGPAMPWASESAPANTDMWATPDESVAGLVALYRSVWEFADELVAHAPLDTRGRVPWWAPERATVTLREVIVHTTYDLSRHAGHADILRELTDGAAGLRADATNLPDQSAQEWSAYVDHLRAVAESFPAGG